MLAAVKPRTMAMTLIRISLAMETAEGERSIEWLMLNVEKRCLTATSDMSICLLLGMIYLVELQVSLVILRYLR